VSLGALGQCMSLLVCHLSCVCLRCACPCQSATCLVFLWGLYVLVGLPPLLVSGGFRAVHVLVGLPPILCLFEVCMSLPICHLSCLSLGLVCSCWSATVFFYLLQTNCMLFCIFLPHQRSISIVQGYNCLSLWLMVGLIITLAPGTWLAWLS
jgi:hypothetical protein